MKRLITKTVIGVAVLVTTAMSSAAKESTLFKVSKIDIGRQGDKMVVSFTTDANLVQPGRDREVVFTPVVRSASGNDSIELEPVTIAGRNTYYAHLRNHDIEAGEKIYRGGSGEKIVFRQEMPFQKWMEKCRVVMREDSRNCCDPIKPLGETPMADLDYIVRPFVPPFRYVNILGDSTVELTAEGKAYIDFIVNRTEIRPTYRRNKIEIAKIIESIDRVKNDPDATITKITIKGFASPEGSYSNNVRLAMGRTASLKEYVREHYNFDPEIMATDYEPEDWEGLREWLKTCTLPHRDEIIEIVDSKMEPDPKDHEIRRRYPEEYKLILDSVYPALRHSDYTVKYAIRTYVDIDELKRVFKTDPRRLRPVDFSRIAATYAPDSKEYKEVFMKAVEIYPRNEEANLNAANIMMEQNNLKQAATYLGHAGDSPEAIYTRAVLAARTGDFERAEKYLQLASNLGFATATEELRRLKEIQSRPTVEYFIEPIEK